MRASKRREGNPERDREREGGRKGGREGEKRAVRRERERERWRERDVEGKRESCTPFDLPTPTFIPMSSFLPTLF